MNANSQKVGLACFSGSLVGGLASLQLSCHFWWLGILLGGAVGYVSYNFKEIPQTVKTVWQSLLERNKIKLGATIAGQFVSALLMVAFILCYLLLGSLIAVISVLQGVSFLFGNDLSVDSFCFFIFGTVSQYGLGLIWYNTIGRQKDETECAILTTVIMCTAPGLSMVAIPLVLVVVAIAIVFLVVYLLYTFTCFVTEVLKRTFILVHSEIRLLCFIDSALGSLVGYYTGNVLLGACAGLFLGVINYELISLRWLKLVKAQA